MSVRGKDQVENEFRFAFMAVNLRKYTAKTLNVTTDDDNNSTKNGPNHPRAMIETFFLSCFG
jgi:hypothetical protein